MGVLGGLVQALYKRSSLDLLQVLMGLLTFSGKPLHVFWGSVLRPPPAPATYMTVPCCSGPHIVAGPVAGPACGNCGCGCACLQ